MKPHLNPNQLKYNFVELFKSTSLRILKISFFIFPVLFIIETGLNPYEIAQIYLLVLGSIFPIIYFAYSFYPRHKIWFSNLGIEWKSIGLIEWADMEVGKSIIVNGNAWYLIRSCKTEKSAYLTLGRFTELSLVPFILKFCPPEHELYKLVKEYASQRKISL